MSDLDQQTTLSSALWSRAFAERLIETNKQLDVMKATGLIDAPIKRKKSVYLYLKEKKILKRLNRCKTIRGKLLALSRILDDVRDECSDY